MLALLRSRATCPGSPLPYADYVQKLQQKRSRLYESDIEQRDALLRRRGMPMPFGAERAAEVGEDGLHDERFPDGGEPLPRWGRPGTKCRSPP